MKIIKVKRAKYFRGYILPIPLAYFFLFFFPTVFSFLTVYFWGKINPFIFKFDAEDNIILVTFAAIMMGMYLILAVKIVDIVWKRFEEVETAKEHDSEKEFMLVRYKRIPFFFHCLTGTFSIISLFLFFIINYHSKILGVVVIGSWSWIQAIWLFIALELQDPISGFWRIEVSEDWLKKKEETKKKIIENLAKAA